MTNALEVYINEEKVGVLSRFGSRGITFSYYNDNDSILSLSLPREDEKSLDFQLRASSFFENLLPEGKNLQKLRDRFNIKSTNTIDILNVVGKEVAGALIFCTEGDYPEINYKYKDATDSVYKVFKENKEEYIQTEIKSRFSLAGIQNKITLIYDSNNKRFFIPEDYSPTNYIIKPNPIAYDGLSRNEQLCLDVYKKFGFDTVGHQLIKIYDKEALLLNRYDRVIKDNKIQRIYQEDFCQALGIGSKFKYQKYGMDDYIKKGMLALVEKANEVGLNIAQELARRHVLSYFLGNFDMHAKNFSLLHLHPGYKLAQVYDIVCIPALGNFEREMAMKIGDEYKVDLINEDSFKILEDELALDDLVDYVVYISENIERVLSEAIEENIELYGYHNVYDKIKDNCNEINQTYQNNSINFCTSPNM